ncbi:hypothetical protein PIB30_032195 [Stylosanthes scabra]|uniref:Uncharacterized protein n=1 Tax=Stylosanthes scabra TaxID=79078 RepID=A0ABU6RCL2_9FABA|nr:hypothetical protein [Stylosanthes scabra]
MEQYEYLLRGYEDTLYRLDATEHVAGRMANMETRVVRTRRNIMDPPDDRIRELLQVAGFGHVSSMLQWDHGGTECEGPENTRNHICPPPTELDNSVLASSPELPPTHPR